jgi:hypothetical protein
MDAAVKKNPCPHRKSNPAVQFVAKLLYWLNYSGST